MVEEFLQGQQVVLNVLYGATCMLICCYILNNKKI